MIYYVLTIVGIYAILGTIQTLNALPRKNKPETLLDKILIPGAFIILPFIFVIRWCIKTYNLLTQPKRSK